MWVSCWLWRSWWEPRGMECFTVSLGSRIAGWYKSLPKLERSFQYATLFPQKKEVINGFFHFNYTLLNQTWKLKTTPLENEKNLQTTNFWGFHVFFRGCNVDSSDSFSPDPPRCCRLQHQQVCGVAARKMYGDSTGASLHHQWSSIVLWDHNFSMILLKTEIMFQPQFAPKKVFWWTKSFSLVQWCSIHFWHCFPLRWADSFPSDDQILLSMKKRR